MPTGHIKVQDVPITRGMNTVDDARDLQPGECRNLINGIPGSTVKPRKGCDGVLLSGSTTQRFVPPGKMLDTALSRQVISILYSQATNKYSITSIPEDTDGTDTTNIGDAITKAVWPEGSHFGMVKAHDQMVIAIDDELESWKADTKALGHKVVESDGLTIRDLCISVAPSITGLTQGLATAGPFQGGGTGQTYTASEATDILTLAAHGYATGDSVTLSNTGGELPGGLSLDTEYYVIKIDDGTFYLASTYANAIAGVRIDLTTDGTGTNAVTHTSDCFGYAFTYVRRNDQAAFNQGADTPAGMMLPPQIVGAPQRIDTPLPGLCESITDSDNDKTIAITAASSVVYIDIGSSHDTAIAHGATHLRVWRSRRFRSTTLAADATKLFLADLPLGDTTTSFTDSTSDASLEGELTQLTMAAYTVAPYSEHVEYVKQRLWLYEKGIGYYSEVVGGDGGCPTADAFNNPSKWAAMFKPTEYYVDCESRDGQESRGICRLEDDLYFFKDSKIHVLLSGDPTLAVPSEVSGVIGCPFPHTITPCEVKGYFGKAILFMGTRGPCVIQQGGHIRPFSEFKIIELWPALSQELYGELDPNTGHPDWIRQNCTAAFDDNRWYVMYLTFTGTYRCWSFHFDEELAVNSDAPRGAWRVVFADLATERGPKFDD